MSNTTPTLVFVASPFRADTPEKVTTNQDYALAFCGRIWRKNREVGLAPHLYFPQFLDDWDEEEREAGLRSGFKWMQLCSKMYVVGPVISPGMKREIEIAQALNIPIIYVGEADAYFADKTFTELDLGLWGKLWQMLCSMFS